VRARIVERGGGHDSGCTRRALESEWARAAGDARAQADYEAVPVKHSGTQLIVGLAVASMAMAQSLPAELTALAAKAGFDRPVSAWCRAEFRAGHPGAFAVAMSSAAGGGRYLVLEPDASVQELGAFTRAPDLSCYRRAEAEQLSVVIGRSPTIHGQISPRWNTAVICAFLDDTTSVCWQYSPDDGVFVKVGGWIT
jgi:hypothetical protein